MQKSFYKTPFFWLGLILTTNLLSLFEDQVMSGMWLWHLIFGISGILFLCYSFFKKLSN